MYGLTNTLEKSTASRAASVYSRPEAMASYARKSNSVKTKTTKDLFWLECVTRIRDQQDQAAFAELFNHFAPRVKSFLMKSGADESLAEECSQEVMVTLWRKAHLFDPTRASVATWIFTIARNKKIDALRRQNRPEPESLPWQDDQEPDAAEALELQQESTRLAEVIEELPDKQRDIVKRAFYGDLSHQEIAMETGLPLGTIKSRIRLALERMRHSLK
jgi:RNA polymerase sigma-70 factor (ECF subfamily)